MGLVGSSFLRSAPWLVFALACSSTVACAAGMDSGKTKRSDPSVCTLGCVLLPALRPVLDRLGGADLQEARDVREPEEAGSNAGVVVLPSSRARPLKETSSSEVDSDEFFDDQTARPVPRQGVAVVHGPPRRPPKAMKKPAAKVKPAGKAKGVKG